MRRRTPLTVRQTIRVLRIQRLARQIALAIVALAM